MQIEGIEAKSCPFCGGEKLKLETKNGKERFNGGNYYQDVTFSVRCNRCHARGGTISARFNMTISLDMRNKLKKETAQKAVEKWNTRC